MIISGIEHTTLYLKPSKGYNNEKILALIVFLTGCCSCLLPSMASASERLIFVISGICSNKRSPLSELTIHNDMPFVKSAVIVFLSIPQKSPTVISPTLRLVANLQA